MDMTDDPYRVDSVAELREHYRAVDPIAADKCLARLDRYCIAFIERSPFVCIGTQSDAGRADVSPRGDPPGFVRVLDGSTLAIPDRPGNNRLDTLTNLLSNPSVGMLFLVPGFEDTLRVNGTARLTRDPALLDSMVVNGRAPGLAIVVNVAEAFLHCAKAFRRSRLWDPDARQDRTALPSLAKMVLEQTIGAPQDEADMARVDADLERAYRENLY